jgi:hypothetical protein
MCLDRRIYQPRRLCETVTVTVHSFDNALADDSPEDWQ